MLWILMLLLVVPFSHETNNILPIGVMSENPLILDLSVALRYKRNFSINLVKAHYSHGFEFTVLPPKCSQTDGVFAFNDDNCAMRLTWQGRTLTIFEEEPRAKSEQNYVISTYPIRPVYIVLRDSDAAMHLNNRSRQIDSFCRPRAIGELVDRREVFELRMIALSGVSSIPSPVCSLQIQLSDNYSLLYEQIENATDPQYIGNHSFVVAVIFLSLLALTIAVIVCRPPAEQPLSSVKDTNKSSETVLPISEKHCNGKFLITTLAVPPPFDDDRQPSTDLHTKIEWNHSNVVTKKQ